MFMIVFSAVLGACFGSFINAAALRYVKKESFITGRSKCPHCDKVLRWFELVPVVSWLVLRGRCRGCRAKISPRYPLAEAFFALPAALCFYTFGWSWMTLLAFGVCGILLAIALIDLDTMEIPNGLVIALIPLAAAAVWAQPDITLLRRGIGLLVVSVPMLLLALIISGAFGGGDVKLMAVCGFLLGWQNTLFAFFLALAGGVVYSLIKKVDRKAQIPFGPFLCAGTAAAMLYGSEILSAYWELLGL
ncbi:MAG: prepilin peptidase [Oscillospiraceae bacterium]|jgi:leader peptidase (prepilin peptidase)/N-methyltransferase|nr:prepilin peptidase [Oscillospiraceae bacterium]